MPYPFNVYIYFCETMTIIDFPLNTIFVARN